MEKETSTHSAPATAAALEKRDESGLDSTEEREESSLSDGEKREADSSDPEPDTTKDVEARPNPQAPQTWSGARGVLIAASIILCQGAQVRSLPCAYALFPSVADDSLCGVDDTFWRGHHRLAQDC